MEEKKHIMTFDYQEDINIKEIQQGDIFRNIPYYSPDYLLKSPINEININIDNDVESIFEDIIINGNVVNAKSIIFPTWAILGSQECDIRGGYDLIFFPLVKYKEIDKHEDIAKFIEKDIQDWTRFMYIPKSDLMDNGFGPFRVLLQNPFYISYEIVEKNLKHCWATHIVDKARRVFVGKITNLFTRTPIDELVFIEFKQIENYFEKKWQKAWNKQETNPYDKSTYEIIDKIIEFYFLLKHENEQVKFQDFKILPLDLLQKIIDLTDNSWIFMEENPFIALYQQLKEDKTINWFIRFYNFIDKTIYGEDSIFKTIKDRLVLIQRFESEEDKEFLNYKEQNIREDNRKFSKKILCSKLESPTLQEEKFKSYCEPFEKLRKFLNEIGILKKGILIEGGGKKFEEIKKKDLEPKI